MAAYARGRRVGLGGDELDRGIDVDREPAAGVAVDPGPGALQPRPSDRRAARRRAAAGPMRTSCPRPCARGRGTRGWAQIAYFSRYQRRSSASSGPSGATRTASAAHSRPRAAPAPPARRPGAPGLTRGARRPGPGRPSRRRGRARAPRAALPGMRRPPRRRPAHACPSATRIACNAASTTPAALLIVT